MTGYSLKEISTRLNTGQIPQVVAGKPIYTQEEVDSELALKPNSTDLTMAIGNINTPLLDLPLKNSLAMKAGVGSATFTRASTATYIDRYGVLKTAAIDEPRFEKEGYLNEGGSTNLMYPSAGSYSTASSNSGVTITDNTSNTTDPFGTNTASLITATATSSLHNTGNQVLSGVSGDVITKTIFAKAGTWNYVGVGFSSTFTSVISTVIVDLSNGTVTKTNGVVDSYKISSLANGWYRISVTCTATKDYSSISGLIHIASGSTSSSSNWTALGTESVYFFGSQDEKLPFATSYIPTTTASVTRSEDSLKVTAEYNFPLNEGSIAVDFDTLGVSNVDQRILQYHTGTTSTLSYSLGLNGGTNAWESYTNGGTIATINIGIVPNTKYRLCSAGSATSLQRRYKDGVLFNEATSAHWQTTHQTTLTIGSLNGAANFLYGHISNVRTWDKSLSPTEVALC